MTLTKSTIADALHRNLKDLSRAQATDLLEATLHEMKHAIARGEKLMISGFGVFDTKQKADRVGRNPKTGEPIPIRGRVVVNFKPSARMKELLK